MNSKASFLLLIIIVSAVNFFGQKAPIAQTVAEVSSNRQQSLPENSTAEIDIRIKALREQVENLRKLLSETPAGAPERQAIEQAIIKLSTAVDELLAAKTKNKPAIVSRQTDAVQFSNARVVLTDSTNNRMAAQPDMPQITLSVPGNTATNVPLDLKKIEWNVGHAILPTINFTVNKYFVEISTDESFSTILASGDVAPRMGIIRGVQREGNFNFFNIPKNVLQQGTKYFWRVTVFYTPTGSTQQTVMFGSSNFTTAGSARSIFAFLSSRGFRLQRTFEGADSSKGAQFGFLRTFGKGTVYSADFALILDRRLNKDDEFGAQFSVEGKLSSKESDSEDAWRFRGGLTIDKPFGGSTAFNGYYLFFGAKFEASQKFATKKIIFESMFTPTIQEAGIGVYKPNKIENPIQFRWRPYVSLDLGRTIRRGTSNETEDTVLRFVPRVTGEFRLNFLRQALNLNDVILSFDETFYILPLEDKKGRNFFTSGLNFNFTSNFGIAFTYKNGESAPQFKRVNTFDGGVTVKF